MSIAPFVIQRFTNVIVRFIRQFTSMTWGSIDDVLVAHHNPECLDKFEKIGWRLNITVSVLIPVKNYLTRLYLESLRCPKIAASHENVLSSNSDHWQFTTRFKAPSKNPWLSKLLSELRR